MTNPIQREKKLRCHWCSQFLSKKGASATVKSPDVYYCRKCYDKGVREEYEAMGLYDTRYKDL
jgi:late competence protein required for DNA uptake (superfamily II DNA/RNA helicase)